MTHLDSIRCLLPGHTHLFSGALRRLAAASSLYVAVAAGTGCVDAASDSHGTAEQDVTATIYPDSMWSNASYIWGDGGSSGGYAQVRFQYTNSAGVHDVTTRMDSSGGFDVSLFNNAVFNGDVVRATWSGNGLDDVGCSFVMSYHGGGVSSLGDMGCVPAPRTASVVINEILANEPGSATAGEFIELVNVGDGTAQLGGWTLSDSISVRHTFAAGTTLAPGHALVVFGGASAIPAGLGNAVAASTATLALNNTGDTVTLSTAGGEARAVVTYGAPLAATDGVSMNRSPDGSAGGQYVLHTTLSSAAASPGARVTGAAW